MARHSFPAAGARLSARPPERIAPEDGSVDFRASEVRQVNDSLKAERIAAITTALC